MKFRHLLSLTALLCSLTTTHSQPLPVQQTDLAGSCRITSQTALRFEASLEPLADYLLARIGVTKSWGTPSFEEVIVLKTDPALATEGYTLKVSPRQIHITGGSYGGVFNGIQTLLRQLPPEVYAAGCPLPVEVPCMQIEDAPRFGYRGMMLDVARTWVSVPDVKRYIDLLAYHNINKLHLHLSDDEGWRIEIKSHPELTEIGGFRGGDSPVRPVYGKWDEKYGGFYTQAEMADMIAYAAIRNIEIIPEIDLPGHSRNIASVHPEIRCNFPPDTLSTNGYDYRSAWCVAREENYALLTDIFNEICALFPSEYIHIGGDEVKIEQWQCCPDCQALMKSRGMDNAHQLEDLFMERMTAILQANGKRPGVWNEAATTGKITHESRVYGWKDTQACLDATANGYATVVMPAQYFYIDMRQTPRELGHDWAAVTDAQKLFGYDLDKMGFSPAQIEHVVGLEAAFWSEISVSNSPEKPDYLDFLCFPRLCVLARLAWNGNVGSWDTYYKELRRKHYDRMAAMDIRFRLMPPQVSYKEGELSVTCDDGAAIFYTRGDAPEEVPCIGTLRTDEPHLYHFITRYKTGRSAPVAHESFYTTIRPQVTITTSMGEDPKVPASNASTYKGVSRTRRACRQKDWIRYTFAQPMRCRELFLQTGHYQLPKTIITTGYAEISYDGVNFERAVDLHMGSATLRPTRPLRAVQIISTANDNGTPYVTIQPPRVKPIL